VSMKERPRVMRHKVEEIVRWLENNYYKKDRDWNYEISGPYAEFKLHSFKMEQTFRRQFTKYYR
jgi:hypothetical protein